MAAQYWTRRSMLGATLFSGAWALAPAARAAAEPGGRLPRPPVLDITITAEGFTFPPPNPRRAGLVTLRMRTPDEAGHFMGLGSLRNGITLEQALQLFWGSQDPDPAVAIPALRALYRDVEFFGGAGVYPSSSPMSATLHLPPGTYWGVDGAFIERLDVSEQYLPARPPATHGMIRMVESGGEAGFRLPSRLRARGAYLIVNDTSHPQECVFAGVAPGTTDRDVQDYFDAVAGGADPPNPLRTQLGGLMAVSPGHRTVLEFDFPPGDYCVLSFYRNPNTARKRAEEGMHRVVSLV